MCGGYNPKGWIGLGEDRDAIAAFLFTWPDGNTGRRPIKLPKARVMRYAPEPSSRPFGDRCLTDPSHHADHTAGADVPSRLV